MLSPVAEDEIAASVTGAVEVRRCAEGVTPRRLSGGALDQRADDNLLLFASLATGVHLRLRTAARTLELGMRVWRVAGPPRDDSDPPMVTAEVGGEFVGATTIESSGRLRVDDAGVLHRDEAPLASVTLTLPQVDEARVVTLWLPHDAEVTLVSLRSDAPVTAAPPAGARWVHHGSSISHALEMRGPAGPWPHRVARELGLALTNLSFAGQAMLDPGVARVIAEQPADLITMKLGINLVNADAFGRRSLGPAVHGFLDLIREGHPHTPLVVLTAIACPIHENHPGPTIAGPDGRAMAMPRERHPRDGRLTLAEVRDRIATVVRHRQRGDERLWLEDGLRLFGPDDAQHLPDNLHPDTIGNDLIGRRFVALARDPRTPLGAAITSAG